jgi:hypothetical protein
MAKPKKPDPNAGIAQTIRASMKAAGMSDVFYSVRRRMPPTRQWSYWKRNIAFDTIDDITEFCYGDGGKTHEYRIDVHDVSGEPVLADEKPIGPILLPALEEDATAAVGEDLKGKQAEIARKQTELSLKRRKFELEREEAKLAELMGEGGDVEVEEVDPMPFWDKAWGPPPWIMNAWAPKATPAVPIEKTIAAIGAVLGPLFEMMRPKESALDTLVKLMPLMKGDSFAPKDMLGLFGPIVTQMGAMSAESSKLIITSMADMDASFRERTLDLVMAAGRPESEVAKWREVLGLVKEGINEVGGSILTRFLGRNSVLDPNRREVKVPRINGAQRPALAGAASPALPAGEKPAETAPDQKPQTTAAEATAEAAQKQATAKEENLAKVIAERVKLLLSAMCEEIDIDSEPATIAVQCRHFYGLLPRALREGMEEKEEKLEGFKMLREHAPAIVDKVLAESEADKSGRRKKWLEEFWSELLAPDDEFDKEEEDPEEEEEEEEEEPEGKEKAEGQAEGQAEAKPKPKAEEGI